MRDFNRNARARPVRREADNALLKVLATAQPARAPEIKEFPEWAPDLGEVGTHLVTCTNCIPLELGYGEQLDATAFSAPAASGQVYGALSYVNSGNNSTVLVGVSTDLEYYTDGAVSWTSVGKVGGYGPSTNEWVFATNIAGLKTAILATNNLNMPQLFSGIAFADISGTGAPIKCKTVGGVGQFGVLGDLGTSIGRGVVQWSAIGDPDDWPIIDSAEALSKQSGRQFLPAQAGAVRYIVEVASNTGLVFQERGISRMTYVGGDVVFSFDMYEATRGAVTLRGNVKCENWIYYLSAEGFHRTNGSVVEDIGFGKVNRTFFTDELYDIENISEISAGCDVENSLIYWSYSSTLSGGPDRLLTYNFKTGRWSKSDNVTMDTLVTATVSDTNDHETDTQLRCIDTASKVATFTGSALVAAFETADMMPRGGLRSRIDGIRTLVTGSPTTVEARVGFRDSLQDAVAYTAYDTAHARTGRSNFRDEDNADARYVRYGVQLTGGFDRVFGADVYFAAQGAVEG